MTRKAEILPVGTEVRSPSGNRFVKVAANHWQVRGDWGVLDGWSRYSDRDIGISEVLSAPGDWEPRA